MAVENGEIRLIDGELGFESRELEPLRPASLFLDSAGGQELLQLLQARIEASASGVECSLGRGRSCRCAIGRFVNGRNISGGRFGCACSFTRSRQN